MAQQAGRSLDGIVAKVQENLALSTAELMALRAAVHKHTLPQESWHTELRSERAKRNQLEAEVAQLTRDGMLRQREMAAMHESEVQHRCEETDRAWHLQRELAKLEAILPGQRPYEDTKRATLEAAEARRSARLLREEHEHREEAARRIQACRLRRLGRD